MRKLMLLMATLAVLLMAVVPAQAAGKRQPNAAQLTKLQSAYAAAIRWGEFEQAWELVDPAYRLAHPMTELAFERYRQIQVSGYSDHTTSLADNGDVVRNIELRAINRHTMAERTVRYREQWRWDPVTKRWWLVVGLPDLWNGQ
ncbi:MAG: hypothetical protein LH491_03400 [Pseudoxanthomonas sp.]|nr:hypothetical protein [Pseudoxanthomonas sp.]